MLVHCFSLSTHMPSDSVSPLQRLSADLSVSVSANAMRDSIDSECQAQTVPLLLRNYTQDLLLY